MFPGKADAADSQKSHFENSYFILNARKWLQV